jgi:hypothetical protein
MKKLGLTLFVFFIIECTAPDTTYKIRVTRLNEYRPTGDNRFEFVVKEEHAPLCTITVWYDNKTKKEYLIYKGNSGQEFELKGESNE